MAAAIPQMGLTGGQSDAETARMLCTILSSNQKSGYSGVLCLDKYDTMQMSNFYEQIYHYLLDTFNYTLSSCFVFLVSIYKGSLCSKLISVPIIVIFLLRPSSSKNTSFCLSVCPSVCPSVRPVCSVCHTFFTMFLSSYHHAIFRSYYQWQKWCPCKRSRS